PCQKQLSMNIATRFAGKMKSGRPRISLTCSFHPRIPERTKCARSRRSVVRLPNDRTHDITYDRVSLLRWSIATAAENSYRTSRAPTALREPEERHFQLV